VDNRRLFLAALLSLAVLLAWQWIFPPAPPSPAPSVPQESASAPTPESAPPEALASPAASPAQEDSGAVEQAAQRAPIAADREERIVLETERAVLEFTNRGAQLLSAELTRHEQTEGGRVDLVRRRAAGPYPFGLTDPQGGALALNDALFAVERFPGGVRFAYSGPAGVCEKSFEVGADGLLEVAIEVESEAAGWGIALGPGMRNPSERERANRFARKSVVWLAAGEVERLETAKVKEATRLPGTGLGWVGLQDTYFLTSWIVGSPLASVDVWPVLEIVGEEGSEFRTVTNVAQLGAEEEDLPRELALALHPEGSALLGRAYLGSKQYDLLHDLDLGLEKTVELGVFSFLARPLQIGLRWIYDTIIGNYGWAIILMTVVIRLVLFPLTHKSFVSMQKMQELNPKIQAIRQKYRGRLKDKQGRPNAEIQRKMNEEVMALYKQEGVNPAGGCLPMLLQIPVLFAFYNLLSSAIELRNAPWLGWIRDLSAPDPLYVLPLVMGASQFVQQRMTPTTADPMQRRIFMLMPVFFTVLFLGFPSGLVLYWLTNNLLGIVQQGVYRRLRHPAGGKN
jgi:YidC/Oxa1 family membrane protein insertase